MARKKKVAEPLPTIWRVDDTLWAQARQVLAAYDPPARFGPDRIDQRKALDGVIYRMRSAACSGTSCPASSATMPACTAPSSAGCGAT